MSQELKKVVYSAIGGFFAIAISMNVFFVRRLVDEIDATKKIAIEVQLDLRVLRAELSLRATRDFEEMELVPAVLKQEE